MDSYEAQLAADRVVTQFHDSSKIYSANPSSGSAYQQRSTAVQQPFNLAPPNAQAISHPADSTAFQRSWAAAQHAADKLDSYVDSIEPAVHDRRYTPELVRDHIAEFAKSPAVQDMERRLAEVRTYAEAAEESVVRTRVSLERPGDTAEELRATRLWNRTQRTLDALPDGNVVSTVQKLIEDASPSDLSALLQEVPAYLESKGINTDFVDDAVAKASPKYAHARKMAAAGKQAVTIAEANAKRVRDRISTTYPDSYGRPKSFPLTFASPDYDPQLI
jgi:hypothetical protein